MKAFFKVLLATANLAYGIQVFAEAGPEQIFRVQRQEGLFESYTRIEEIPQGDQPCFAEQIHAIEGWLSRNRQIVVSNIVVEKATILNKATIELDKKTGQLVVRFLILKDGKCLMRDFRHFDQFFSSADESAHQNR